MKKIVAIIVAVVLLISVIVIICARKPNTLSWQEQYDLGMRYLADGNYEEAIIAFNAAIKIDPKRSEVYLGLAYAYIGQGDYDAAKQILEQGITATGGEELQNKLDEILSGRITDYDGLVRRESIYDGSGTLIRYYEYNYQKYEKNVKTQISKYCYDASGTLLYHHEFDYNASTGLSGVTAFNADGTQMGHADIEMTPTREASYGYDEKTGEIFQYVREFDEYGNLTYEKSDFGETFYTNELDDEGYLVRQESRNIHHDNMENEYEDIMIYYYEYDELRRVISKRNLDGNGNPLSSYKMKYDADGNITEFFSYDRNNKLDGKIEYFYDESGNMIEQNEYDGNGNLVKKRSYN